MGTLYPPAGNIKEGYTIISFLLVMLHVLQDI